MEQTDYKPANIIEESNLYGVTPWSNLDNAKTDDLNFAISTHSVNATTQETKVVLFRDFQFDLPKNSKPFSIHFRLKWGADTSRVSMSQDFMLFVDEQVELTRDKYPSNINPRATADLFDNPNFGALNLDMVAIWGGRLNSEQINSPTFGVGMNFLLEDPEFGQDDPAIKISFLEMALRYIPPSKNGIINSIC